MSTYTAEVSWQREGAAFTDNRYSRVHTWRFDGGVEVRASSSPQVVPVPMSAQDAVDPEEAFIASLSSCHMLWFLAIAGKRGFIVDSYTDNAAGTLARGTDGKTSMTEVVLHPDIQFSGARLPTDAEIDEMHHKAHAECFIANSVKSEVRCEPVRTGATAARR